MTCGWRYASVWGGSLSLSIYVYQVCVFNVHVSEAIRWNALVIRCYVVSIHRKHFINVTWPRYILLFFRTNTHSVGILLCYGNMTVAVERWSTIEEIILKDNWYIYIYIRMSNGTNRKRDIRSALLWVEKYSMSWHRIAFNKMIRTIKSRLVCRSRRFEYVQMSQFSKLRCEIIITPRCINSTPNYWIEANAHKSMRFFFNCNQLQN